MDQLKEALRQMIKYRFWIAVGISALLPMIAYAVGSGPIKKKAEEETKNIEGALKGAQQYATGVLPNDQYGPLVDKQKDVLTGEVNASWKKLYDRQAGLLEWPETVSERFKTWGRQWPKDVDPGSVRIAITDYVQAYPKFVTQVYKTFDPFDPMDGKGIVAAPSEAALLRPAAFKIESPPELGKVWAAQERLWIQRTLLKVVAEVNQGAKEWDKAIIKQVNKLEVGNSAAQDQLSLGKGEALEEAPALDPEGAPAAAPAESSPMSGTASMMGSGLQESSESVYYIKSPNPDQFKILPVNMSVLIDQSRIQDFLVALENSPMAIQVIDFEMAKPSARVTKPVKGEMMSFGDGMMGMGGMMGRGMTAIGGNADMYRMMMQNRSMGMNAMPTGLMGSGMYMNPTAQVKKGVDKRGDDRVKKRQEELKRMQKSVAHTIQDPYYFIVEVSIYGQARFYNPPPAAPAAEASQAAAAATTTETPDAKKAEAPKAEEEPAKKVEGEPAKKDEGEPAKKAETPKADGEPAKKAETPKADGEPAKKAETPKADGEPANKAETPKAADGDSAKAKPAEAPKSDAPKADSAAETPKK